jgi:hypothetical protein
MSIACADMLSSHADLSVKVPKKAGFRKESWASVSGKIFKKEQYIFSILNQKEYDH